MPNPMTFIDKVPTHYWELDWDKIKNFEDYKEALKLIEFSIVVQPGHEKDEDMLKYYSRKYLSDLQTEDSNTEDTESTSDDLDWPE